MSSAKNLSALCPCKEKVNYWPWLIAFLALRYYLTQKAREAKKELKELFFQNTLGRIKNTDVPLRGPWSEPPAQILKELSGSKNGGYECEHVNWSFFCIQSFKPLWTVFQDSAQTPPLQENLLWPLQPQPHAHNQVRLGPFSLPCIQDDPSQPIAQCQCCGSVGSPPSRAWWLHGGSLAHSRHLINDTYYSIHRLWNLQSVHLRENIKRKYSLWSFK